MFVSSLSLFLFTSSEHLPIEASLHSRQDIYVYYTHKCAHRCVSLISEGTHTSTHTHSHTLSCPHASVPTEEKIAPSIDAENADKKKRTSWSGQYDGLVLLLPEPSCSHRHYHLSLCVCMCHTLKKVFHIFCFVLGFFNVSLFLVVIILEHCQACLYSCAHH